MDVNAGFLVQLSGITLLLYAAWCYVQSPLRLIAGPRIAAFTNLWRVASLRNGSTHLSQLRLHRRWGRAVRLGPNMVSLSDATLVPTVYSSTRPWLKSDMYASNDVYVDGVKTSNVFATRDQGWHNKMIKPLRNMGTITKTLANCEGAVDETIGLFCAQMDRIAREGTTARMEKWLLYFAYDCLYRLTFGVHRGYVETGTDVGDFIKEAYGPLVYFGLCVSMPVIDLLVVKNPLMKPFLGKPPFVWAFQQAHVEVEKRKARHEADGTSPGSADFLDMFLASRDQYPDIVTDDTVVVNYLFGNLVAGSDTTGTSLAATVYHLYRDPRILEKLRAELEAAGWNGSTPVTYRDGVRLPFLDAVVQEGLRIHPPIGLALERVVPAGGWQVPDGPFLPAGTKVGMNSYISNRDEAVFGPEDVDAFVPERWMPRIDEPEQAWNSRISRMKNLMLTFGHGNRVCTGKSVAMLELIKLVGTFVGRYDIEFVTPEWSTMNMWFIFPSEFNVKVTRRKGIVDLVTS